MNDLTNEKTMTIKEVAEILKCSESLIREKIKTYFPDKMQNGIKTNLNEKEITVIKLDIQQNPHLAQSCEVETDLEMMLLQKKLDLWKDRKIAELQKDNAIMKPKADAYDIFIDSSGLKSMNEAGKLLKIGRNKLFEILRKKQILMKNNLPYQKYLDLNYFEVKNTVNNNINFSTPLLTPDGLCFIERLLQEV
jgi:phage antirepressor YoqD-like protein